MSLTQSAVVALAGLSLGIAAQPVQAQAKSGLTATLPSGTCGQTGVTTGAWLSYMNKPDELSGMLFGPGGNELYELRAQLSANYYTTSGGVAIQPVVGGLFGNLYDLQDPTQPIANLLGSWSKSPSGLGQFEAVVLELDSKYVLGAQVMGEIRGMFGPSELLPEPPVLIVDPPPAPNVLIDVLRPHDGHGNLEDDVILANARLVQASGQQKVANRAGMGASGQSSASPSPAMSAEEPSQSALQPYGDDVILTAATIVQASGAQKTANRSGMGADKIDPHPYGDDVILVDARIVQASGQQQAANRAGLGASGQPSSSPHPQGPVLQQSVQASAQQKTANRAGAHFQGEGEPYTEPHGYNPHDAPSPSGPSASGHQGIGMQLPTSDSGALQIGASGSAKTANRTGLGLNQQPMSGGFVGTWILCF